MSRPKNGYGCEGDQVSPASVAISSKDPVMIEQLRQEVGSAVELGGEGRADKCLGSVSLTSGSVSL